MKLAIIYTDSIYHEGDERSRTNPGHGYPAYSESIQKIEFMENEGAVTEWIESNERYSKKPFKVIQYEEVKVEKKIEYKFK